jgi:hypothetical protein
MSRMETVTVDSGTHAGIHVPVPDLLSILIVSLKEDKSETEDEMSETFIQLCTRLERDEN